jgi:hypothetical protein
MTFLGGGASHLEAVSRLRERPKLLQPKLRLKQVKSVEKLIFVCLSRTLRLFTPRLFGWSKQVISEAVGRVLDNGVIGNAPLATATEIPHSDKTSQDLTVGMLQNWPILRA